MTEPKQYGPFTEADLIDTDIEQRVAWAKSQFSTWKPTVRWDNLRYCTIEEEIAWELLDKAIIAKENLPEFDKFVDLELQDNGSYNDKYMNGVEYLMENNEELPPEHKEFVESGKYAECQAVANAYDEAVHQLIEMQRWNYYWDKWNHR